MNEKDQSTPRPWIRLHDSGPDRGGEERFTAHAALREDVTSVSAVEVDIEAYGPNENIARHRLRTAMSVLAEKLAEEAGSNSLSAHKACAEALEMVRDADDDCKRDGLQTIPPVARAKIDAALAALETANG
jgi:hypothetical protein